MLKHRHLILELKLVIKLTSTRLKHTVSKSDLFETTYPLDLASHASIVTTAIYVDVTLYSICLYDVKPITTPVFSSN